MTVNELLFHLDLKTQTPLEKFTNGINHHRYIIDEYPIENKSKNYIYFLICENEIVYVGQTRQGFYRRIKEHKRHLSFYNYVVLRLEDGQNVNDAERYWINKCNPILNGILIPWENHHCKSTMGFNGTVYDVLQYAKERAQYYRQIKSEFYLEKEK